LQELPNSVSSPLQGISVSRRHLACCLGIAFFVGGCSEPPPGLPISGTVTFRGQPLDLGTIEFAPAAGQATFSGGAIKEGQYSIPAENGLKPGEYDVRISATKEGEYSEEPVAPGEARPLKQLIPPEFNSDTKQRVVVKESGNNKFDFTIP
jgi:hypothetical protein